MPGNNTRLKKISYYKFKEKPPEKKIAHIAVKNVIGTVKIHKRNFLSNTQHSITKQPYM
jgi:hypothetical protein